MVQLFVNAVYYDSVKIHLMCISSIACTASLISVSSTAYIREKC